MTNIINNLKSKNKKAFTMVEILMITIVIWIGLLSIVVAISKAKVFTNQTKQSVIATQLAQEWIEMVYQIRNTNLLKHSNYKNYCRLNINPNQACNSSVFPNRITEKNYILSWQILSWTSAELDIWNWVNSWSSVFWLCLTWWQRSACPWSDNQTRYWKFFRTIEWKWLYLKNSNNTWWDLISCINWNSSNTCKNNNAKEFRFCSKVEYIWTKTWNVEICGVLTNFFD